MAEIWNDRNLVAPVYSSYKNSKPKIDIDELGDTINHLITQLRNQKDFELTSFNLARLIYVHNSEYRLIYAFREMKKVNQACNCYKKFDIIMILENFLHKLDNPELVPARENLEFVLVKILGLSKLLCRIISCAKKSSNYFLGIIEMAHLLGKSMLFLSHLSAIWEYCRTLCRTVIKSYQKLYSVCQSMKLQNTWLPASFQLPDDLAAWLGDIYETDISVKNVNINFATTRTNDFLNTFESNETEENTNTDDELKLKNMFDKMVGSTSPTEESMEVAPIEKKKTKKEKKKLLNSCSFVKKTSDCGEHVERSTVRSENLGSDLSLIVTTKDVQEFISRETEMRMQSMPCATSALPDKKWKKFRILIKEQSKTIKGIRFVNYFKEEFRNIIRKKKKTT